jgi:preprotein translocase subunit SecD
MQQRYWLLALILAVVFGGLYVVFEPIPQALKLNPVPVSLGLDLRGGTQLTLLAKPTTEVPKVTAEVLQGVKAVVEQRVNGLGVAEATVQAKGVDQLLIQLPGVKDPDRAIKLLGDTAQLDFREQTGIEANGLPQWKKTGLTGADLKKSTPQSTQGQSWDIALEFTPKGGDLFAKLTGNLGGTGRRLGIFLDNKLVSAPTVGPEFAGKGITGGKAVITGAPNAQEAADTATKLNAGALPVPVEVIENRTVGATLGEDSLRKSLTAGLGGTIAVLVFMVAYYRMPGFIADIALLIYTLTTLAIFKLIPVTLTLPGIAGFILSIGIAVDANVLIFERTKEEIKSGKKIFTAVEAGFSRAFSSILDSHVTTLVSCTVLFILGSGILRGFALTLGIGILVSLFSALTCTRTLLYLALNIPALRNPVLFGVKGVKPSDSSNTATS